MAGVVCACRRRSLTFRCHTNSPPETWDPRPRDVPPAPDTSPAPSTGEWGRNGRSEDNGGIRVRRSRLPRVDESRTLSVPYFLG